MDCNLTKQLSHVIDHNDALIQKTALWIVANILAGVPEQIQVALESGLIDVVLEILLDQPPNML